MKLSIYRLVGVVVIVLLFSCNEESIEPTAMFEVTVAGEGIDCGLTLIDFQLKDFDRLYQITGSRGGRFNALGLDKKFKQVGEKLIVTITKTKDGELFVCRTLGPSYEWVTVLDARVK